LLQYLTSGRSNQYRSQLLRLVAPGNSTNLNQSQLMSTMADIETILFP